MSRPSPQDLERWRSDVVAFASENFVGKDGRPLIRMWSGLEEMLRAYEARDMVAIKAGRKVSKSTFDAIVALHWPIRWPDGKVVITSAGNQNIAMVLWPEIRRLVLGSRLPYPDVPKLSWTGINWDDGRMVVGYSTNEQERAQGVSGAHLLYIVDEASGVEGYIMDAILGNIAADGCKVMMTSNPTRPSGFFFDAFHGQSELWHNITIRSTDSPNIVEGREIIPGLASRKWLDNMAKAWGIGTGHYDCHINGEFPQQSSDAIIPLWAIQTARERYSAECDPRTGALVFSVEDGPLRIGVDPARFGDDETIIVAVRGNKPIQWVPLRKKDGSEIAERVVALARQHRTGADDSRVPVCVDEIGIGASVVDHLAHSDIVRVVPVNASERADDEDRFVNMRAQLWHALGEWIKDGGMLPDDERLAAELASATYRYNDATRGRFMVEPKADMKKKLGRSPDRADALALAVRSNSGGPMVMPFSAGHDLSASSLAPRWAGVPGRGFG